MQMDDEDWPVRIIRSEKRKKTISAEVRDGILVVRVPANISNDELQSHINSLRTRLKRRVSRRNVSQPDEDLEKIARDLNSKYFAGKLKWDSIRYVTNQNKRFGSCTPSAGTIRISHRLSSMPKWVIQYVVIHELSHLVELSHNKRFWKLVNRYPLTERARGYLMAVGLESIDKI